MRQNVNGITYDTSTLTPLHLWHNHCPPDHPQYQRYIVYRHHVDCYVVWVKTGIRRGGLNQLVVINHVGLTALYRGTEAQDRRRSLARVLQQLAVDSQEVG
ncbi:hypothetical protein [Sulfobacillus harzensis]|uniref:Uncharacterized protein n=1 Tax=Sulfobacillus harzensis TaxID=2729629 RepID=A0A7Y0L734_9FIRM|nr:hypothetical protein [Sulfobacillus harzensis]NMP24507.1 hypothetical protein [Sulfobacillus harzensis]